MDKSHVVRDTDTWLNMYIHGIVSGMLQFTFRRWH
jgi:hypothetical protein